MEAKMEKKEAERNEKIKELTASTKKKMEEVEALKNEREAIIANMEETDPENESVRTMQSGSHDCVCSRNCMAVYQPRKRSVATGREKTCVYGRRKRRYVYQKMKNSTKES